MATASWANFWNMTTDAGFRVIGSNISANLAAVNNSILTQTADTGQINWTTVTKPVATLTSAGYEIWKFTDSQGTFYFKLEYGTANSATASFAMWVTVGTGSNGSGTITGIIGTRRLIFANVNIASTSTNYTSHLCVINGLFWFMLAENSNGANTKAQVFMAFARTGDSTGAVDNVGFELISMNSTTLNVLVYWNAGTTVRVDVSAANFQGCFVPFNITSSDFGTGGNHNYQVFRHQLPMSPEIRTPPLIGTYIVSEAATATTTIMAIVGSTTHTCMFTGACMFNAETGGSANYGYVLVYE